jgi:2-desacetyl-2-hydroxyethyl bacteriochlorophyllide A dehydrogenase
MRQIQLRSPGVFVDNQVPSPVVSEGHALVRMRRVGVCGSDFHALVGRHPMYSYPRVLGHELAGEVVELPAEVANLRVGDRCAIEPYVSCGQCRTCRAGRTNCCEILRVLGIHMDGGMQGLMAVPINLLHRSDSLSFEQLALVETLGIGAHAVRRSGLGPGEEALVMGAGPIGLAVGQFAQATGAKVRVVEKNDWRRAFAERLGMRAFVQPDEQLADVVFDATGSPEMMGLSLRYVAPGGRLVYAGLTRDPVCIDDALLHRREVTLYASRNSCGQFPRIIRMIEENKVDTGPWVTHRMALVEVPDKLGDLPLKSGLIKAIVEVLDGDT